MSPKNRSPSALRAVAARLRSGLASMQSCCREGLDGRFATEEDAARALLGDVTTRLCEAGVAFVIVGGWVTKLFHSRRFGHPGTFDVDVLLEDRSLDDGSFERATEAMLAAGYVRAVKNRFQAHRVIEVAGERLIFHADFLNQRQPIGDVDVVVGTGRMRSIYTPAMALVLKYGEFRKVDDPTLAEVRFPSADTFIATKARAALVKKRQRDAFDIFVTLWDEGAAQVGARWATKGDGAFVEAADSVGVAVQKGDAVAKVLRQLAPGAGISSVEVRRVFDDFLASAGWNPTAQIEPVP